MGLINTIRYIRKGHLLLFRLPSTLANTRLLLMLGEEFEGLSRYYFLYVRFVRTDTPVIS